MTGPPSPLSAAALRRGGLSYDATLGGGGGGSSSSNAGGGSGGGPVVLLGAEEGVPWRRGSAVATNIPGDGPDAGWPTLLAQLLPLSTPAVLERLHSFFGLGTGRLDEDYAEVGSSREQLLHRLVQAYEQRAAVADGVGVVGVGVGGARCERGMLPPQPEQQLGVPDG